MDGNARRRKRRRKTIESSKLCRLAPCFSILQSFLKVGLLKITWISWFCDLISCLFTCISCKAMMKCKLVPWDILIWFFLGKLHSERSSPINLADFGSGLFNKTPSEESGGSGGPQSSGSGGPPLTDSPRTDSTSFFPSNIINTVGASVGAMGASVGASVGAMGASVGASVGAMGASVGASVGALGATVGSSVKEVGATVKDMGYVVLVET